MKWRRIKHLVGIHYWVPHLEYFNGMLVNSTWMSCFFCGRTRRNAAG